MPKLLVIDDEPNIRFSIKDTLESEMLTILEADTAQTGIRMASAHCPDIILLDIRLGSESGLDVFHDLRRLDPKCLIVFITGHGTTDTAIEAMKLGAFDYLVKPLELKQLQQVVGQACAISRLMHVPAILEEVEQPDDKPDHLIGSGQAMQVICKQLGRVAPQDVNVLIRGESGTGKELVARALYHHSHRSQAPFLAINCAAIPESLLESELFGHERGAFTDASHRRIGKFEQCDGGTLFLDEIGDMALNTQAKILRLIQEGQYERLGGSETISVNVRVIAATNQNLDVLIQQGRFRNDLYYRLRGVTIQLPPLRERREDIAELAHYFLFRFKRKVGSAVQSISPDALDLLQQHHWPGNIRELQNVIREAVIISTGPTILPDFLPAELRRERAPESIDVALSPSEVDWRSLPQSIETWIGQGDRDIYRRALESFDRLLVATALQHSAGNQAVAAETLGLSRVTLRAKLRALGMGIEKVLATEKSVAEP